MKAWIYKFAKTPFFGRFMVRWENPLPVNQRQEWNSFSVKSKTGALLQGLWASAHGNAKGTIVLESIPTTLEEFWVKFQIPYYVLNILYFFMPGYAKKVRMIDRIRELNRIKSLLLIYSETDHYSPVSMGVRFKHNSNVPTELWTVEDAEHAKIIKSAHRKAYEEKIQTFVRVCLVDYDRARTSSLSKS